LLVAGSRRAAVPLAALAVGLGLVLAGCGASSPASPPASSPAAAGSAAATPSAPAATAAPGTLTPAAAATNPACPSAAAVSAATGTKYDPPTAKAVSGAVNCSYQSNSAIMLIALSKATFPASDLRQVTQSGMPADDGVKFTPVSGLGDAAFQITFAGESAALELVVQSGSRDVTILGPATIDQAKALARLALGL
jgi:hypothetical protein